MLQRAPDQLGLRLRRPDDIPWSAAVAETGTVDDDDPVFLCGQIDQPAGFEILNHAAITMQKHQRFAGASFQVVQPDTVHIKEPASRRVVVLGLFRKMTVQKCRCGKRSRYCGERIGGSRCRRLISSVRRRKLAWSVHGGYTHNWERAPNLGTLQNVAVLNRLHDGSFLHGSGRRLTSVSTPAA